MKPPCAERRPPSIVDVHVHHNGEEDFLNRLVDRLRAADAMACILTTPAQFDQVQAFLERYPDCLVGFGDIALDHPEALAWIDRFYRAGFDGLGEFTASQRAFDHPAYLPIYERAAQYRLITLFHTGIVFRPTPRIAANISSHRLRITCLDAVLRQFPDLVVIAAHMGNPDYAWAAELARWNPNLYLDLSGSTLIETAADYRVFHSYFWWSGTVSPHTPPGQAAPFAKLLFASDIFWGELDEFDRSLERHRRMLEICGVDAATRQAILGGTAWRLLSQRRQALRQSGASGARSSQHD